MKTWLKKRWKQISLPAHNKQSSETDEATIVTKVEAKNFNKVKIKLFM